MIKAIIFDFDGLILETETPEYESWRDIFEAYGCVLPFAKWADSVGSTDLLDPYEYLEELLGEPVDRAAVRAQRRSRFKALMANPSPLPGVEAYIFTAKQLGLKLGVASSSSRRWVTGYLSQLGLEQHFDSIKCSDDVERTKPDPALYLLSLQALDVEAHEAIVLEDSLNGVLAAKRAGIFAVAVPNAMTQHFSFEVADLQLSSLAELSLEQLLVRFKRVSGNAQASNK